MSQSLGAYYLIELGGQFLKSFEKIHPVAVAYWSKQLGASNWYLYVASPNFDDRFRSGYSDIADAVREMSASFDPGYLRLEKMDDPTVQFMLDFQRKFPGRILMVEDVPSFSLVEIDGVYLYPPAKSAAV